MTDKLEQIEEYLHIRHNSIKELRTQYADDPQMEAYYRGEQSMIEELMGFVADLKGDE